MDVSTYSAADSIMETPRSEQALGHLSYSTLSMRAKAERKRKVGAFHNSNFRAGFVPVTEDALHRTGIRGRKRYFLYCTLGVMMIIAIFNSLITAWLIYVLGLSHMGLTSIELSDYGGVGPFLRVLHEAHIITVTMNRAPLGARYNSNVEFMSEESPLYVLSVPQDPNKSSVLSLDGPNLTLTTESLRIRSDKNDKWVSADLESIAANYGISNFMVDDLVIRKITSRKDMNDLYLESASREVTFNASKGMMMKSNHDIELHARAISLQSKANFTMFSKRGIYINPDLPKVSKSKSKALVSDPGIHKVCICGNGKLFLIPSTSTTTSCRIGKKAAKAVCGNNSEVF